MASKNDATVSPAPRPKNKQKSIGVTIDMTDVNHAAGHSITDTSKDSNTCSDSKDPDDDESTDSDPPAHRAAQEKRFEDLKQLIDRDPQCIYQLGLDKQTVLHDAVAENDIKAVCYILETVQKHPKEGEPLKLLTEFMNLLNRYDETPLHLVAVGGSVEMAKLLISYGADVDPKVINKETSTWKINTSLQKSPFHKAVFYSQTDLALYLLSKGAEVSNKAFRTVIRSGQEQIAEAVIKSNQWFKALRGTYQRNRKWTTAFRELIVKMPDVAKKVLDRCVVEQQKENRDKDDYKVLLYFEFIEDHDDEPQNSNQEENTTANSTSVGTSGDVVTDSTATNGISFEEITMRECHEQPMPHNSDSRGPKIFTKGNHPLQIMVKYNREKLLCHPVTGSLIYHKWTHFGLLLYLINLISFVIYLGLLTGFALTVPNPQSQVCHNMSNITTESNITNFEGSIDQDRIVSLSVLVLLFAFIRFGFEIIQFIAQFISFGMDCCIWPIESAQLLPYVTDWVNWIEIAQYSFTIAFAFGILTTENYCVSNGLWQTGAVSVFLGWMVFVLFISKFPVFGIYVIILTRIFVTYLQMIVLMTLMIVGFGITFFLIFYDMTLMRSPFTTLVTSLFKTMTMSIGEVDFNAIFHLDPSGGSEGLTEIPYPPISYILWIVFIFLMPVVLINMLTSLAVDDTEKIRSEAKLQSLALQVDMVLSAEEVYFCLKRCLKCLPCKWHDLQFEFWGGDRYDENNILIRIMDPPKGEEVQEVFKKVTEIEEVVNGELKRDIQGEFTKMSGDIQGGFIKMNRDIQHTKGDIQEEFTKMNGDIQGEFTKMNEDIQHVKEDIQEEFTKMNRGIQGEFTKINEDTQGGFTKINEGIQGEFTKINEDILHIKGDIQEEFPKMNRDIQGEFTKLNEGIQGEFTKMNGDIQHIKRDIQEEFTKMNRGIQGEFTKMNGDIHGGFTKISRDTQHTKGELTSMNRDIQDIKSDLKDRQRDIEAIKRDIEDLKSDLMDLKLTVQNEIRLYLQQIIGRFSSAESSVRAQSE